MDLIRIDVTQVLLEFSELFEELFTQHSVLNEQTNLTEK